MSYVLVIVFGIVGAPFEAHELGPYKTIYDCQHDFKKMTELAAEKNIPVAGGCYIQIESDSREASDS